MGNEKRQEVKAWLAKAGNDLRAAEVGLAADPPLVEDALFHCQQATEKAMKAFLAAYDTPFRKPHDLKVDLGPHLDGEMFEPLREIGLSRKVRLNADIDTVVWYNGVDMSPDFLYEIGEPVDDAPARNIAKDRTAFARKDDAAGKA